MTATAHALVGGVIAASIQNPAIGLPLAAASHPLLDMVPHWDIGVGWKKKSKINILLFSFMDLIFGVGLTFLIFGRFVEIEYLIAAIFLSEVWDIMMMPYLVLNWKFPPFSTFYHVQSALNNNIKLPWGILTQIGTIIAISLFLRTVRFGYLF